MSDNRTIPPPDLAKLLEGDTAPVLLDLRKPPDYSADPRLLPGALKRDLGQIEQWAGSLPPDKQVVVYCAEGKTVGSAAVDWLRRHGYSARQIEGGFAAWRAAGLPLQRSGSDEP